MTTAGDEDTGPARVGQDSPYLAARRAWNDHVGRLLEARNLWQAVALLSLVIALAAVGGLVHVSSKSQIVPYVVEVDRAGNVQAVNRADAMPPATRAVVEAQLEKFITLSRRVTTDIALQKSSVYGVFSMLTPSDPAAGKMRDHLKDDKSSPFERAKRETVATEIESVLQQTADSWQVQWTETVYDRSGVVKEQLPMQALVEVYQSDPRFATEEALRTNPLGVYVRDFNWSRRQGRQVPQ